MWPVLRGKTDLGQYTTHGRRKGERDDKTQRLAMFVARLDEDVPLRKAALRLLPHVLRGMDRP